MQQDEPGRGGPLTPLDLRKIAPIEEAAASDRLGWVGMDAARYSEAPAFEFNPPDITHHRLILYTRPPEELDLMYEGVNRHMPPPAGAISLVPAGSPHWVRSSGCKDELHICLEPGLVARVAAEAFGLDPARLTVPPLDGLDLPHLRAAMGTIGVELTAGAAGGWLAAESLANVLSVHLIRHILAPRRPARGPDGAMPRGRLRAVDDGTWHVARRTFPFQPTMKSGFPHHRDSWLSAAATSWAVLALTQALPIGPAPGKPAATQPTPPVRTPKNGQKIDFVQQIKPLLERSCVACHRGEKPHSLFRIDGRDAILKGGASGAAAIVPGHSEKSPLIAYVSGEASESEMPPRAVRDRFPALSPDEVALLRAWVDLGAEWPAGVLLTSPQIENQPLRAERR